MAEEPLLPATILTDGIPDTINAPHIVSSTLTAHELTLAQTTARCGMCKYWQRPGHRNDFRDVVRMADDPRPFQERYDEYLQLETQYGKCTGIQMPPQRRQGDPLPLAVTMDGSDYKADLYTLPNFGCMLYEPLSLTPSDEQPALPFSDPKQL
jgi:hypothetical protein